MQQSKPPAARASLFRRGSRSSFRWSPLSPASGSSFKGLRRLTGWSFSAAPSASQEPLLLVAVLVRRLPTPTPALGLTD